MPSVTGMPVAGLEQLLSSISTASPAVFAKVDRAVLAAAGEALAAAAGKRAKTEDSAAAATSTIQELIGTNDLVIFTAKVGDPSAPKECPYCKQALEALQAAGILFKHEEVGMKGTTSRQALTTLADGIGSVPVGFCMQTLLGGFDETDGKKGEGYGIMPLLKAGKIQAALDKRDGAVLR